MLNHNIIKHILAFVLTVVTAGTVFAESFSISYRDGRVIRDFPERTRPVVGLALSGGGARGIAHLGVIQVLEENGIRIERISGTSMGSIVGGLYAAGYNTQYLIDSLKDIDWSNALSSSPRRRSTHIGLKNIHDWPLFELRFSGFRVKIPSSLSTGQHFITALSWLCLGPTYKCGGDFDRLPIPFRPVATDFSNGTRVVLKKGNLARAVQASSTIPLLFTPIPWDDMILVDGGFVDYLPVSVARDMGSDFVIASAVDESMHSHSELDTFLNIADQASSIPTRRVTQLSKSLADYAVSPDMEMFSSTDFSAIPGIIEQGRKAAFKALPSLLDSLESMTASYRKTLIKRIMVTPAEDKPFVRETLLSHITPGDSVKYANIADALETLWASGKYFSIEAKLDESSNSLDLTLTHTPGSVIILLDGRDGPEIINETISVLSGSNEPQKIQDVITMVSARIRKIRSEGFSLAHIHDTSLNSSLNRLTVKVAVPHLSDIVIDENLTLKKSVILRELNMEIGSKFNLNEAVASLESLYGTDLFEWVYADIEPDDEGVRLIIHVREKKWGVARFGLRFDETCHTKARATISRENILGFGNRFSATFEVSARNRLLMVESRNSRIYKSLYNYSIKAYKDYRLRFLYEAHDKSEDYGDDRYGAVFSIGQHMDKLGNAMLRFKTETLWITTGPREKLESTKKELRSIIIQSLIDGYDRYPFPRNGLLNIVYVETTSEVLGGTDQFVKLFWGGSLYRTLWRRHTFSGSFCLGSADPSLPDIETFTLGGSPTRLNCHDWESSGSHFYADFPGLADEERSGNRLAVVKANYRLFIPRLFYLDFTYSIGNVWGKGQTISSDSLIQAFGIKGSFSSIGGPVSMGWGITSEGDDRVYLSAGKEF